MRHVVLNRWLKHRRIYTLLYYIVWHALRSAWPFIIIIIITTLYVVLHSTVVTLFSTIVWVHCTTPYYGCIATSRVASHATHGRGFIS